MLALLGTSFTFLMTALGAATVFFFARKVCERAQGALLGFAAGVMMAASVWSLILPAIEQTEAEGRLPPFLPAAAGIVLGALTLFLNPCEDSYLRLGGRKAPRYISWSSENRSQLIRIPAAQGEFRRAELRSADPTANPYLAFALLIRAGLDGIERRLTLPEPADFNLYTAPPEVLSRYKRLPASLAEAAAAALEAVQAHVSDRRESEAETQYKPEDLPKLEKALTEQAGNTVLLVSHSMDEIARNVDRILVLKNAHILMEGTPQQVFARGEELLSAGLDVPQVTRVAMALRARGLNVDPAVYTVEALERELLALRKGGAAC